MMLSGINVFKSTLFFLVWAEVLLHLEHKMKFTSGKSSLQTHLADLVIKTSPHYAIPFCVLHLQRSNTQIYRMNVFFFFFFLQKEAICISKQLIKINRCLVINNVFFV